MAETKSKCFYKRLDQVNKANPAFGDTEIQDRNLIVAFILAVKYIYSFNNGECEQRPQIENWIASTDANWYYSSSFNEPLCTQVLAQFKENFEKYKDLECFKCFTDIRVFNIQTAKPYNDYIFNNNNLTKYVFDLNEYLNCLIDETNNLKEINMLKRDIKSGSLNGIPEGLKNLEKTIIKNANTLAKEQTQKRPPEDNVVV